MSEDDNGEPDYPPEIGGEAGDTIDGTEVTVYEWQLLRKNAVVDSGRCINVESDGRTVMIVGVSDVGSHNGPFGGSHMGISTYYSDVFVLSEDERVSCEPKYTMTVHPDDVEGQFLSL